MQKQRQQQNNPPPPKEDNMTPNDPLRQQILEILQFAGRPLSVSKLERRVEEGLRADTFDVQRAVTLLKDDGFVVFTNNFEVQLNEHGRI
jgi:Fe2+ or Zn2+ uptake regulation protein